MQFILQKKSHTLVLLPHVGSWSKSWRLVLHTLSMVTKFYSSLLHLVSGNEQFTLIVLNSLLHFFA
jgi:hypothetical protein